MFSSLLALCTTLKMVVCTKQYSVNFLTISTSKCSSNAVLKLLKVESEFFSPHIFILPCQIFFYFA